jgi:hypothetical protein
MCDDARRTLNRVSETMTHPAEPVLFGGEPASLRVLYAGRDQVVWALPGNSVRGRACQCASDGGCQCAARRRRRRAAMRRGGHRRHPGDAHPLQVIKAVKAQASDLPVVVLTATGPKWRSPRWTWAPTARSPRRASIDAG